MDAHRPGQVREEHAGPLEHAQKDHFLARVLPADLLAQLLHPLLDLLLGDQHLGDVLVHEFSSPVLHDVLPPS